MSPATDEELQNFVEPEPRAPAGAHGGAWRRMAALCACATAAGIAFAGHGASEPAPAAPLDAIGLATRYHSSEHCAEMFDSFMAAKIPVTMKQINMLTFATSDLAFKNGTEAASLLKEPTTNMIEYGDCKNASAKRLLWVYPDASGDRGEAFLVADGECQRMEALFEEVDCVHFFRLTQASFVTKLLQPMPQASIVHAVLGGHGWDSSVNQGFLVMSETETGRGVQAVGAADTTAMLNVLRTKLAPKATVFLDSCFGGINGMAQMVSETMPEHWVFGGVVSLTSDIKTSDVPFGGGEDGPVRVVTENAPNGVLDFHEALNGDYTAMRSGQAIEPDPSGSSAEVAVTDAYMGERLLGFYGGQNRGPVTQWLKPSNNSQVIRTGVRVRVVEELLAYKFEFYSDGLETFPTPMPAGMNGTVVFMMNVGKVVNSGSAVIVFDLPASWTKSYDGGLSTGPLVVAADTFKNLEVVPPLASPAAWETPPAPPAMPPPPQVETPPAPDALSPPTPPQTEVFPPPMPPQTEVFPPPMPPEPTA